MCITVYYVQKTNLYCFSCTFSTRNPRQTAVCRSTTAGTNPGTNTENINVSFVKH